MILDFIFRSILLSNYWPQKFIHGRNLSSGNFVFDGDTKGDLQPKLHEIAIKVYYNLQSSNIQSKALFYVNITRIINSLIRKLVEFSIYLLITKQLPCLYHIFTEVPPANITNYNSHLEQQKWLVHINMLSPAHTLALIGVTTWATDGALFAVASPKLAPGNSTTSICLSSYISFSVEPALNCYIVCHNSRTLEFQPPPHPPSFSFLGKGPNGNK